MDRKDAEKLLGKKTSLPGAGQPPGANWTPKAPAPAASAPAKSGIAALPADPLRNPKAVLGAREKDAGLACGGKVKKYAKGGMVKGGMVKGAGSATRGKKFSVR